ncbi:MAG: acetamidase/formamidase family protein [Dehalococcoidales bacterium]
MKVLSKDKSNNNYDVSIPPALKVASGEIFQLETPSILTHPERFPNTTVPVTGPIYVEGAKPGSTLKVDILKVELTAGKGAIAVLPGKGAFGGRISEPTYKVVTYDDKYVYFNERIKVPIRPMVGKVGTSPLGKAINCHAVGPYGGNMDITDIKEGTSVYLPVFAEGALLACGDTHAAMGDGESCFSAVETESSLTLRCQVIDDMKLVRPMVVTADEAMTVGDGRNLEEAYRAALDDMVELITAKIGLNYIDTIMLISIAADVRINQIVNTVAMGVRVALPLSLLPPGCIP